jgi:hypothetical protein
MEHEKKIFVKLMNLRSGNAYTLWKETGLKHYPTVLRTLKRLKDKKMIKVIAEDGSRGEKIYAPSIQGRIIFYLIENKRKELLKFILENSTLFKEVPNKENWILSFLFYFFSYPNRERLTIDDAVRGMMELRLSDGLGNIVYDVDARKEVMELSMISFAKPILFRLLDEEMDRAKKELKEYREIKNLVG